MNVRPDIANERHFDRRKQRYLKKACDKIWEGCKVESRVHRERKL